MYNAYDERDIHRYQPQTTHKRANYTAKLFIHYIFCFFFVVYYSFILPPQATY